MPVMNIWHVSVFVLGVRMLVFVRVDQIRDVMIMELVMAVPVFVDNRHVDVKMGMFLVRQQVRAGGHKDRGEYERQCDWIPENKNGKKHACQRRCAI